MNIERRQGNNWPVYSEHLVNCNFSSMLMGYGEVTKDVTEKLGDFSQIKKKKFF